MTIGHTKDDQKWMFYEAAFTFPDECFHYSNGSPKFQQSWTPILITLSKYISLYQGRKKTERAVAGKTTKIQTFKWPYLAAK